MPSQNVQLQPLPPPPHANSAPLQGAQPDMGPARQSTFNSLYYAEHKGVGVVGDVQAQTQAQVDAENNNNLNEQEGTQPDPTTNTKSSLKTKAKGTSGKKSMRQDSDRVLFRASSSAKIMEGFAGEAQYGEHGFDDEEEQETLDLPPSSDTFASSNGTVPQFGSNVFHENAMGEKQAQAEYQHQQQQQPSQQPRSMEQIQKEAQAEVETVAEQLRTEQRITAAANAG